LNRFPKSIRLWLRMSVHPFPIGRKTNPLSWSVNYPRIKVIMQFNSLFRLVEGQSPRFSGSFFETPRDHTSSCFQEDGAFEGFM